MNVGGVLDELLDKKELPVIIINPDFDGEVNASSKYDLLLDFMQKQKYNKVFENGRFEVYSAK